MAIKRLADVYPNHYKRVFRLFLALVITLCGLLVWLLVSIGVDTFMVAMISGLVMLSFTLGTVAIMSYALEPLDFLSRVITHVSKQPNDVQLPNLNGTPHEKNGYKEMLDTVYALSLESGKSGKDTPLHIPDALFDKVPCGITVLNETRDIIYSNAHAPVVKQDDIVALQLLFEGNDTLDTWLSSVESSKVRAEKVWPRIQNLLPGNNGRKLYDVYASYQKNATDGIETVILTIDKTASYAPDEENMDFIALAAHELRGPVTVIHGYLDILQRDLKLSPEQQALFDRLEVSASRLSGYIGNVLNASKYDRRHLKLHLHEDHLSAIYRLIADDIVRRAKTQNRTLSVHIPTDLPTIAADRNSLSEVLANFIDNAIKYSNEGGQVTITADVDGEFVRVQVRDNGIGIPASVIGNLFSKFYRSHRSRSNVPGTGLGLYISKAIIESHGGHVSVISKEGEGSTFSFSVPIYNIVRDKLLASGNQNEGIIETSNGWIKNHAAYRG